MRIGAIDLGSNSFHILVADFEPGGVMERVTRSKEHLRLGEVVATYGHITEEAEREAIATVLRLRDVAIAAGAEVIFGGATSAFRDATNGADVLQRIQGDTGVTVRLIDGCEEGRLVFEAVQASIQFASTPAVCLDLGGGSLEVVVGDQSEIHWIGSLPLGVARLRAQLLKLDPPSPAQQRRLRNHASEVIAQQAAGALRRRPAAMIGAGGTFRSLARMVAARRSSTIPSSVNGLVVQRSELVDLADAVLALPPDRRSEISGVGKRRADLAPAGALVVLAAMEVFGHEEITVAEWTLREGLILDTVAEARSGTPPPGAALTLAIRHDVDLEHATHVANLACRLFDGVRRFHPFDSSDRDLLAQAALLHDVGSSVDADAHHKAGARIVLRAGEDLGGQELAQLVSLIRFHVNSAPKCSFEPYASLDAKRQETVGALLAVLRVADWLAGSADGAEVAFDATSRGVTIDVPLAYTAAAIWELSQRAQSLERLVGCSVDVGRCSAEAAAL